ncbi:MAG: AAA-like domain-containing protein [Myxococcales bacterium]|nr:AAA-like domain-containing protein [Myxococcales bacterium]
MQDRWALADGEVDLARGLVHRGGSAVELTTKEVQLLRYLVERQGQDVPRAALLRDVWGFPGRTPASRAPDFVVQRLRRKIERDPAQPAMLLTVFGQGYRLEAPVRVQLQTAVVQPPGAPYEPGWYAARPAEEAQAASLLTTSGAPVVLLGPQGQGKSWLLHHLLAGLPLDHAVVLLDAAVLPPADPFEHIALEIADQVGLSDAQVSEVWDRRGDPRRRLLRFLEHSALPRVSGCLVIALDRADQLADGAGAGLYAWLRSVASRPGAPWDQLRLLLAISTEPALLVTDPGASPFNLAPPVRVGDLEPVSVAWLAERHDGGWSVEELDALRAWVGGHPFLVRRALARVADGSAKADVLRQTEPYADVLRSRLGLLRARPDLLELTRSMLAGPLATSDPLRAHELERVGVARIEGGRLRFAYAVVERFLRQVL